MDGSSMCWALWWRGRWRGGVRRRRGTASWAKWPRRCSSRKSTCSLLPSFPPSSLSPLPPFPPFPPSLPLSLPPSLSLFLHVYSSSTYLFPPLFLLFLSFLSPSLPLLSHKLYCRYDQLCQSLVTDVKEAVEDIVSSRSCTQLVHVVHSHTVSWRKPST